MAAGPDDILHMEKHFREWLTTAKDLTLADLIQDSRVFINEICRIVSCWKPEDPPLPPLLPVLSRIFQRISVDNQTVLFVSFFEKVVKAHDANQTTPRIPSHLYPKRNRIQTSTILPIVTGKRKVVEPVAHQEGGGREKRRRTIEVSSESDGCDYEGDELSDDLGSGKDVDEEQQVMEEGVSGGENDESGVADGDGEEDEDMDVDQYVEPSASRTEPRRGSSSVYVSEKPRPVVETSSNIIAKLPPHPADGLTAAELENTWRLQAGDTTLKFNPRRSEPDCEFCLSHGLICWTVPGQRACLCCRYEKKRSCSNAPPRTRTSKERNQPKPLKTVKAAKSSIAKKPTTKKEPTAAAPSTVQRAKSKKTARQEATEPELILLTAPIAQGTLNVTAIQQLSPVDHVPVPPSLKIEVNKKHKVNPPPPAVTLTSASLVGPGSPASPEPFPSANTEMLNSNQETSCSRAGSLSQPTANVLDPLLCAPASDWEVRYIPPFAGSSLVPRLPTPPPHVQYPAVTELYARIGGLEADVRRLFQDNTRLRDYVQGAASLNGEASLLRKELKGFRKEQSDNQAFHRDRLWELGRQMAELTANVQILQKQSNVGTSHLSEFLDSSRVMPNDTQWAPYSNNPFDIMGDRPPAIPLLQDSNVQGGFANTMEPTDDITSSPNQHMARSPTPPASPEPSSSTSAAVHVSTLAAVATSSGTVNPQDTRLAPGAKQLILPAYQLGQPLPMAADVEMMRG